MGHILSLDHIAVALSGESLSQFQKVMGLLALPNAGQERVDSQGVMTHFYSVPGGETCLELLEPVDPQGVVAKFLVKKGPGIHHLCFRVEGLEELMTSLSAQGIQWVYEQPRSGAHGCRVNFIHPRSAGGILLELSEVQVRQNHSR